MKVGILGSGEVGQTLADGFLQRGHHVAIGSRTPEKLDDYVKRQRNMLLAGDFARVAKFGEILVIATKFRGTKSAIDLAGPENFAGKIVIDVTNPIKGSEGKAPDLLVGFTDSAGETIQRWLPKSRVVKAFNAVGSALMIDPEFADGPPTMFIAGNDEDAKKTVTGILESFGWDAVDAGPIERSRLLEPLAILWILRGMSTGKWHHAFKLLQR
ncbi:MAG: NADPH-dependent F420 reductase [Vulcanimicrobiaceae bacterium]